MSVADDNGIGWPLASALSLVGFTATLAGHMSCSSPFANASYFDHQTFMSNQHDLEHSDSTVSASRRTFCVQACQAASCLALAALAEACGGTGGGSSPSNV